MTAVNVVFRNTHENYYYGEGLCYALQDIFPDKSIRFRSVRDLSYDDTAGVDVLILDLCRGEEFICHPELFECPPQLLIGLTEDEYQPEKKRLPLCLRRMSFICKNNSAASITQQISQIPGTALKGKDKGISVGMNTCHICPHRDLSVQQKKVVDSLCRGMTINQIARRLLLNQKTIYAHKQFVYRRFNLRCNRDLLLLHRQIKRLSRVTRTGRGGCNIQASLSDAFIRRFTHCV